MSSGARRGASEENILAMLERDAARRRMAGNPRFAMYAISGLAVVSLMGALAWLLHENNNSNEILRLPEQPGVSVTVVPDKPANAPAPAVSESGMQPAAAATIIDNPEPSVHKVAETAPSIGKITETAPALKIVDAAPPVNKLAEAAPAAAPRPVAAAAPPKNIAGTAATAPKVVAAATPANKIAQAATPAGKVADAPASKSVQPQPAAQQARDELPPLVMLKPSAARAAAAKQAASAQVRAEPVKQAASAQARVEPAKRAASAATRADVAKRPGSTRDTAPTRGSTKTHELAAARGTASAHGATTASKKASPARDDTRRVAARQRSADDQPARTGRAAAQAKPGAHAVASANGHPATARTPAQERTKKASAPADKKADGAVDTDVALISAIIMHADGRTQHRPADAGDGTASKKIGSKPAAQP
jgi:hypothetical protein